jgi:aspartate/methionine/tyrosine aminotransferase
MAIEMAGCRTVCVETDANFQLDLEALRAAITPRTRAVVTVSPNNPSGAVYPESALRAVNELCAKHGLFHIHDEAYDGFTYGVEHVSPGSFNGAEAHTISLFSLSKSFGFAGWRMGFMVVPTALFDAVKKIQDTNLICASAISQAAALGALSAGRDYFALKVRELGAVRDLVRKELSSLSDFCTIPQPQGAFYFLLKVQTALAPLAVVERLVKDHKVAVLPGSAFFPRTDGAACYLRLAYGALERDGVLEGVRRFTSGLRAVVKGS